MSTQYPIRHHTLALGQPIRETLKQMLKGRSREQVAEQISRLSGLTVREGTLSAWTGTSRTAWRLPAEVIPALEVVTGSNALTELLVERAGGKLLVGDALIEAELANVELRKHELTLQEARLRARLSH